MGSVFAAIVELVFFMGMLALRSDERVLSFHSEELCFFHNRNNGRALFFVATQGALFFERDRFGFLQ